MRVFTPDKVPRPSGLFAFERKPDTDLLAVEIGCGVGMHALRFARANPRATLVAIERTEERYRKFERRIANHERLPNLLPVRGDAVHWISHALTPASVDKYFLLYPNPCPKEKQANLRWHNMPFFGWLVKTLRPGGELLLATNEKFYVEEALERMKTAWGLGLVRQNRVERDADPLTHFERKYLERGDPCVHLLFRKE